jgi:tubulin-specific chaperone A
MAPSQLQIRTNALSRLLKEEKLYHGEVEDTSKRIEQMKVGGSDEYEIKKMVSGMLNGACLYTI